MHGPSVPVALWVSARRCRPASQSGKAADGKRLQRLEPDPVTAPIVQRTYREYLSGFGVFAIAQRLPAEGISLPLGLRS
ncbi:recombinase family protein [Nocardia brevicatena]|uniref:recombinase family protein n=1 Tax=Nocardia brevicatena TaxID=37327 RepID=UPI000302F8D0|nr:recombinase family protein [Nocardia brevicatena]